MFTTQANGDAETGTVHVLTTFPCACSREDRRVHEPVFAFRAPGTVHADPVEPVTPIKPSVWFVIGGMRATGARNQQEGPNEPSWRKGNTSSVRIRQ